jgi:hypothetical protein
LDTTIMPAQMAVAASPLISIRKALNLYTADLNRVERQQALKLVQQLTTRLTAEAWAAEMGWQIPAYGTPDWVELFNAWLDSSEGDE